MRDTDTITLTLDRRGFLSAGGALAGTGVAFASAPLTGVLAAMDKSPAACTPLRAVYQGMAYVSFDGTGALYDAPTGNRSTRDYVNSLTREEYLRRHWLT